MKKLKRFLVLGTWYDKDTGQPKSSISEISEGIGKKTEKPYQITDTKSTEIIDGKNPVGTILEATMTLSASTTQNFKINAEK
jgi:hypothetical protein